MTEFCSVPGCRQERTYRTPADLCGMHHHRLLQHGDVDALRPSRHEVHPAPIPIDWTMPDGPTLWKDAMLEQHAEAERLDAIHDALDDERYMYDPIARRVALKEVSAC